MNRSRWLVVGAGTRVRTDLLPVLVALEDEVEIAGLYSRRAHPVEAAGRSFATAPLAALDAGAVAAADVAFVCVAKPAVPAVLRHLAGCAPGDLDLLIDTPVLLFRHLAALPRFAAFRRASVAEDCSSLPWIPLAREALGGITGARFEHSAYHYHGFAMVKTLLGCPDVRSARRVRLAAGARVGTGAGAGTGRSAGAGGEAGAKPRAEAVVELVIELADGRRGVILEPRDYARGRIVLSGPRGTLSDAPGAGDLALVLAPDGTGAVLRAGAHERRLDPTEAALLGPVAAGDTVTSRMEDMKRVGLLALVREVLAGRTAYPLLDALEDSTVDDLCERLGRHRVRSVVSVKSRLGRTLLRFGLAAAGGRG